MTEVAVREGKTPVAFGVPLHGLDEAYRLSQALAISNMLPTSLRGRPSDVLAMLLYGQELGLGPMQSIQSIYVVEGRPSLSAQLWRALARRAGHKVRVVGRDRGQSCTVEVVRCDDPDHPHRETYTVDDAVQAGKAQLNPEGRVISRSKDNKPLPWETTTDDLLAARATARACRFACPEVALGFYTEGEIEDDEPVTVTQPAEPIQDAEIVPPEQVADEVAAMGAEFDFSVGAA